jgi:16S rRNA (guanine966-N2)-methyltransferase
MTRIVAGAAGGRTLVVPRGRDTRPTSDRTREGLFSALESLLGTLAGRSFLDLYAGSGAVGLEAASRGARPVTLVESSTQALAAIRRNVELLGLGDVDVRTDRVAQVLSTRPPTPYDVVFLDPPYANSVDADLEALLTNDWLAVGGVAVVERASREDALLWPEGLTADRSRRYGEGTLWYGRRS